MKANPILSKFFRREHLEFEDAEIAEWMRKERMAPDHAQLALDLMNMNIKKETCYAFVPVLGKARKANIARLLGEAK